MPGSRAAGFPQDLDPGKVCLRVLFGSTQDMGEHRVWFYDKI